MRQLATAPRPVDAYAIELSPSAKRTLSALSTSARMAILTRLAEIAHVAGALRAWMADEISSTLHFQVAGYAISYVMSDAQRKMQVLSVAPADTREH